MFNVWCDGFHNEGLCIRILDTEISKFGDSAVFNVWCVGVQYGSFMGNNADNLMSLKASVLEAFCWLNT